MFFEDGSRHQEFHHNLIKKLGTRHEGIKSCQRCSVGKTSNRFWLSLSNFIEFTIVPFTNQLTPPGHIMNRIFACLVKTAVTSQLGNFFSLEIPMDKIQTEEAVLLLRSWSYDNWLYYDRRAAKEFIAGNLNEAVLLWCKAFMELGKSELDDPRLHVTLENLVDAHLALKDLKAAEEFAERSLMLNKTVFGADSANTMNCHSKLGQIYYRRQRYTDARKAIEECERIANKLGPGHSVNPEFVKRTTSVLAPPKLNRGPSNIINQL